jgi:hypothetical protein
MSSTPSRAAGHGATARELLNVAEQRFEPGSGAKMRRLIPGIAVGLLVHFISDAATL